MTTQVAHLWRYPIKGIGCEACARLDLTPEGAVVSDRAWALLNAEAEDTDAWQPRRNFLQVASGPRLSCIGAETRGQKIRLTHPERAPLEFDPRETPDVLGPWLGDLWPADRPAPARLVKAPPQGMTDEPYASVSVGNLTSLKALEQKAGVAMEMRRFRINIWLDGLAPWEEGDLGELRLGTTVLSPVGPIERCRAPDANPVTGDRDLGMLSLLEQGWGTRDFGVFFKVTHGGSIQTGDVVQ